MRMIVSGLCVFICVCVIMSASVLCMLFKPWAQTTYPEDETLYQLAPYIGSAMSVVSMIVLGAIYGYINVWLTLFENHQTESQFETS